MSKSELEEMFLLHLKSNPDIPEPVREYKAAPGRKFRWDFAWEKYNLLVEIQGGTFIKGAHNTGVGLHRDYEKQNFAALWGWLVMEFDNDMIRSGRALKFIEDYMFGGLGKDRK